MSQGDSWIKDPSQTTRVADELVQEHVPRNGYNECLLRLFYDVPTGDDINWVHGTAGLDIYRNLKNVGFNLLREMLDSAASQICKPMKAALEPVGTHSRVHRNCKVMNRVFDGIDASTQAHRVMKRAYRNCQVTDHGCFMWSIQDDQWVCERLNPLYHLWPLDDTDKPGYEMYVDAVPRANLGARYPRLAREIEGLPNYERKIIPGVDIGSKRSRNADTVKLVTAYATTVGDRKGKYVLSSDNGLVLEEHDWDYSMTPIVSCRWDWDWQGFAGVSLARVLVAYHLRVTRNKRKEDEILAYAVPSIMADEDTMQDAKFSNIPMNKITIPTGANPPQVFVPSVMPKELIESTERDYQRAAAESGGSQEVNEGQAPLGIDSGKGLREWVAMKNSRQQEQHEVWTQLHTDSAKVKQMLGSKAYQKKAVRVRAPGTKWLNEVKWPTAKELKENEYEISYSPQSGLSNSTAGKIQEAETLGKMGLADQADVARMIAVGVPDIQRTADRINGPRDLAELMVDMALGESTPDGKPHFMMPTNLQGEGLNALLRVATERFAEYYARFEQMKVSRGDDVDPEEDRDEEQRLLALRKLIKATEARLKSLPAPTPPAAGGAKDGLNLPPPKPPVSNGAMTPSPPVS